MLLKPWSTLSTSALLLLLIFGNVGAEAASGRLPTQSTQNERDFLKYLWPVLKSSNKAARIYYRTSCDSDSGPVPFPSLKMQRPSNVSSGLTAVREIFLMQKGVTISEDDGIIRVEIGSPPTRILRTRLHNLKLNPRAQYNNVLAINAMESSSEVQSAIQKLNLNQPSMSFDILLVQQNESEPHLPDLMTSITFDRALDQVASVFKGVVFYGICPGERRFEVGFTGGRHFDDRWLNEAK